MTDAPADPDLLFRVLSHVRRRYVLFYLRDRDATSLDELADVVAGWTTADTDALTTPRRRERVLIDLDHVHLPMLADAGLVAYDRDAGEVTRREVPDAVDRLLDVALAVERTLTASADTGECPQET